MVLSKTQIDKLGDRLKSGSATSEDLRELDEYRRSFGVEYDEVVAGIESSLKLTVGGRRAKTVHSIVAKLQRESIRLTQIQDIAGCRIVVDDTAAQNRVVSTLQAIFADALIVDRRQKSSYGYRAVHVVVRLCGKSIEVQVRTILQHQWAEVSEKYSDLIPGLKYGGGDPHVQAVLVGVSEDIAEAENLEDPDYEGMFFADEGEPMADVRSNYRSYAKAGLDELMRQLNDRRKGNIE